MVNIDSIFKLTYYCVRKKQKFPAFKTRRGNVLYFKDLDHANEYIANKSKYYDEKHNDIYAYTLTEIPLGVEIRNWEYLSSRIYLPDGTLWGEDAYAHFFPHSGLSPVDYNYWGRKNMFHGRHNDQIKFKPGDIVEILGCPENIYWSDDEINLAVIVKTPSSATEIYEQLEQYIATHSGFDTCEHALSTEFGSSLDTYEVLSPLCPSIDHAPTIFVFEPTKKISARRKNELQEIYERYLAERK